MYQPVFIELVKFTNLLIAVKGRCVFLGITKAFDKV